MKLAPLTEYELEFIRWRIWEPLKRNQYYQNEYAKLKAGFFMDLEAIDAFCDKWKLPYPVHPDTELSELTNADNSMIISPFGEYYKPVFDHAAFVDPWQWIVNDKYLNVWIDLEASRNQIEKALKKELDEWRSKWKNFYQKTIKKKINKKAVIVKETLGNYLGLYINLEAPRTTKKKTSIGYIEPEISAILSKVVPVWEGNKKKIHRLQANKWALCFQVYDMVIEEEFAEKRYKSIYADKQDERKVLLPVLTIAVKLKIKIKTIYKQYKRAYQSIYPEKEFADKQYKRKEIAIETLKTCESCNDMVCLKSGKLCPEKEAYASQDTIKSGGISSTECESQIDYDHFKHWQKIDAVY